MPSVFFKLMDVWSGRFDWIVAEQLMSRFLVSFTSVHFDISWGTPIWTPLVDCRNSEASMSSWPWDWKPRWRMNPQCKCLVPTCSNSMYTDVCLHTYVWLHIPRYHLCMPQLVFVWKWGTKSSGFHHCFTIVLAEPLWGIIPFQTHLNTSHCWFHPHDCCNKTPQLLSIKIHQ